MEHRRELANLTVAYEAVGDGPPVLFLHGLADDHRYWLHAPDYLAGYQSYLVDMRGHGGTELGNADGTLDQLAQDLLAFVEEITGPAICVGFSGGAVISLRASMLKSDLVRGLVLMATTARIGRSAAATFERRHREIREGRANDVLAELHAVTEASIVRNISERERIWSRRVEAFGDGLGYANACSAMLELTNSGLLPLLPEVRVPTYVIGAERDTGCPPKAVGEIVCAAPISQLKIISGAGHLLMVDAEEEASTALKVAVDWCEHILASNEGPNQR